MKKFDRSFNKSSKFLHKFFIKMDKEIVPPSPLSFDTSLIKFFCKTPETEKANTLSKRSSMKTEKKPEKIQIEKTSHGRFLFETDPSFEDISIDLIKTMGNEETKLSKEKFDGMCIFYIKNHNFAFFIRIYIDYESQR